MLFNLPILKNQETIVLHTNWEAKSAELHSFDQGHLRFFEEYGRVLQCPFHAYIGEKKDELMMFPVRVTSEALPQTC